MINNTFGKNLKQYREDNSLSEKKLGEELGYSNQTISFWEIGRREPCLDALVKIAKFFETSTDSLLGLDN